MPAISGREYLQRMEALKPNVWLKGQAITENLISHPVYKGAIQTKASLYDLQVDKDAIDFMTFQSPFTQNRAGMSYLEPKTIEDLQKRRKMIEYWANATCGMMGRSPDYMNTALMAISAASAIVGAQDEEFSKNLRNMYETALDQDLSFTHSFINPQVNRSSAFLETSGQPIGAKVIKKTAEGLIIKGARLLATEGGMTDEVLIFPSGGNYLGDEYAFAFSIPANTKGLKFICREPFHTGESAFNYPLSSRFDEMDTLLVFDHVLVPWNRVFFYHRQDIAYKLFNHSGFISHALHQVVTRQTVKLQFLIGLSQLLINTLDVSEYEHIKLKLSEMIIGHESMKALLLKSEAEAKIDAFGTMTPSVHPLYAAVTLFSKLYPHFISLLQQIGAGGLMVLPSEEDFTSPIGKDVEHYLQGSSVDAKTKTKLFRLVWELTMSSFGTRQTHYERYFFGDPIRLAKNLYSGYEREQYVERVTDFLNQTKERPHE
ncbi:4-hydroxyphenylacetate 3-monooxygenase, oxygenase component [Metabacillus idriensis]|uniref:4-hydroxyphenylacetate 3-monooxygenase, oxygenase component n=1 Tax=Metabacillus idriensis TaxID=324768 RepID=UPI003D28BB0B